MLICVPSPQELEKQKKAEASTLDGFQTGMATQRSPAQSPDPKASPEIHSGPKKKQKHGEPDMSPPKPKDLFGAGQFPRSQIVQAFQ